MKLCGPFSCGFYLDILYVLLDSGINVVSFVQQEPMKQKKRVVGLLGYGSTRQERT